MAITQIDLERFNAYSAKYIDVKQISDNLYVGAYSGDDNSGHTKAATIEIVSCDSDYDNIIVKSTIVHDINDCQIQSVVVINSTHIAVLYENQTNGRVILKTFYIDYSDSYALTLKDSHDMTSSGEYPVLRLVDSTHLLAVCWDTVASNYARAETFSLDGSYNITSEDDINFFTSTFGYGMNFEMIETVGYEFLCVFSESWSGREYWSIFTINSSNYDITETADASFPGTTNYPNKYYPVSLKKINDTHFIQAHNRYVTNSGQVWILELDRDASPWTLSIITDFYHHAGVTNYHSIIVNDAHHATLAYTYTNGTDKEGHIKTLSISDSYALANIEDSEQDSVHGEWNCLAPATLKIVFLGYSGNSDEGWVKTFEVFTGWPGYINTVTNPGQVNPKLSIDIDEINGVGG